MYVCEYVLYVAGDNGGRSQEGVRSPPPTEVIGFVSQHVSSGTQTLISVDQQVLTVSPAPRTFYLM